jgi:hypothetical protein
MTSFWHPCQAPKTIDFKGGAAREALPFQPDFFLKSLLGSIFAPW